MADAFAQFETLLREFISPAVIDLEFKDDDPGWNLIGSFQPETMGGRRDYDTGTSGYPPGYEAQFVIKVQSAGRVTGGKFTGNTLTAMGADSHLFMGQAADAKFLDPRKSALRAHIRVKMILKRILGDISINFQQIVADLASNPLEEVSSGMIEDATKRVRGKVMNEFYGAGDGTIAQVNLAAGYTITETAGGVEVVIDNGTWGRFMKGDLIVAGSDADPRILRVGAGGNGGTGEMRVVSIDQDLRTIKLQSAPGVGNISLSDDDHLILGDNYDFSASSVALGSLAAEGVESLLINSGVFPGTISPKFTSGLDVTNHTELKSFITDTSSTLEDPTMEAVTLQLDKILDLEVDPPTAFIAERSLWTKHAQLERENNALVQVPMGATFRAAGGVSGPMLGHMEHTFQRFNSKRIRPNSILGLNPSTFRRYIPLGDRTIQWVYGSGPLAGIASIFGPAYDGVQLIELASAPFNVYIQFGCLDPRANFRRLGLKTQRDT